MARTGLPVQEVKGFRDNDALIAAIFAKVAPHDKAIPEIEVRRARERLGASSEQQLQWALKLAQENLSQLGAGDWLNMWLDLWAFSYPPPTGAFDTTGPRNLGTFPTEDDVRRVHQAFGKILRDHEKREPIEIAFSAQLVCQFIPLAGRGKKSGVWRVATQVVGYVERAEKRLFDLLSECGDRLKKCAARDCGRWFVGRPNKKHCSLECQNRANVRNFRKKEGKKEK